LLVSGSLLAACGSSTPAGGDPGGRRLKALGDDRVFAALPDGATRVSTIRSGARYRKPGFSGGGWDGPSVVVTFETTAPPAEVYRFYARQAQAAGWEPTAAGALGATDRWAKTYPDGARATLTLALVSGDAPQRVYRVAGGVEPATR
jgi:hypothetical protein